MQTFRGILVGSGALTALVLAGCKSTDNCAGRMAAQPVVRAVETRANTFTYNRQTDPSVGVDSQGQLLVAWGSRRQEQGTYGVFAQRFDALGGRIGSEIHVNQTVRSMQLDPAVAYDGAGTAWIVWQSDQQDGDQGGIIARRFGSTVAGECGPLSDEILVNQTTAGHQSNPALAVNDAGQALIAWTSDHTGRSVVMGRLLAADGSVRGEEFALGTSALGRESAPAIADLSDGSFVLVWARTDADNQPGNLYARRAGSDGAALGDEFVINDDDGQTHIEPSVDADAAGRFVVAWMLRQETSYAVAYRVFESDGVASGPTQIAASGPQWHSGAAVAVAPDGRFVISYNVDTPETERAEEGLQRPSHRSTPADVWAQCFRPDGTPLGERFRVNRTTEGRQAQSIAASGRQAVWMPDDRLAFVWTGNTGQDDKRGVGLSLLAPKSLEGPTRPCSTGVSRVSVTGAEVNPLIPPIYDPDFVPEPRDTSWVVRGPDYGFLGTQYTGWTPPDPDIGAGPEHVVLVVNGEIAFFDQAGNQTFSQDISGSGGFWGEVGATFFVFDPVTVYDVLSGRFIAATAEHADNGDMALNLAVSDDPNPNGTWHKYRFNVTNYGDFLDFPNLGVDDEAIYISADFFDSPTGNWIFIIPKAPTLVGDPVSISGVQTGSSPRSLGNVKTYDADAPAQYFATTYSGSSTHVALEAITDPLGTQTLHSYSLPVSYFTQPPDAEQLGTSNLADTIDFRIKNGVYRNGSLWLVHTTGEDGTARIRWHEVEMNGWPTSGLNPSLRQSGTLDYGPGQHNWMSDINVDDEGNAIICMSRSSSSEYISAARAIRAAGDPLGTFREPVTMQESTSPETGSRWGDFAGVDEEPDNPGTFWTHNEYRTSEWRTWVGQVVMPDFFIQLQLMLPNGAPTLLEPGVATEFDVEILMGDDTLVPGSALLYYRYDDGEFQSEPLTHVGGDLYTATLPPANCDDTPEFYLSAEGVETGVVLNPESGTYIADVGTLTVLFEDDFDGDQGWTVSGDASDGHWERGAPVGGGDRGDPPADYDGSGQCYLTDNVDGNSDVDDGYTYLHSPTIDLSEGDAEVRYALWYTNNFGDNPNDDLFKTWVSNDDGANWTLAETIGPNTSAGWTEHSFMVGDFVTPTGQVKIRFEASDLGGGSVVEAGIDAFQVLSFSCEDEVCFGDLDGDNDVDLADLAQLLGSYGVPSGAQYEDGDLDGDGDVDLADLAALLGVYGTTCP